jgi:hypothetical protein
MQFYLLENLAKSFTDEFELSLSYANDLIEKSDFDGALDLIKGATHKYLRRYPTGKASPKWYYVYKVTSKYNTPDIKEGEKIKLTSEGKT